ncbi:MAG: competence/damage-inducible protein A [Promethearchaeota archaeon]
MTVRVELLIIGNELLSGHTLDTNSQWLAQRLLEINLPISQILVIEDHIEVIATAIKSSVTRQTRLLITSGGLGPTFDDLTAKGLALAADTSLEMNPLALKMVSQRYKELKAQGLVETAELIPSRKKMAKLPQKATPLPNSVGSAPGIRMQLGNTIVFCLPGVSQELYAMFMDTVIPRITPLSGKVIEQDTVYVPILDESVLAPLLDQVMSNKQGVYLKSLPRPYQSHQPLRVALTVTASSKEEASTLLSTTRKQLEKLSYAHRQSELPLDK